VDVSKIPELPGVVDGHSGLFGQPAREVDVGVCEGPIGRGLRYHHRAESRPTKGERDDQTALLAASCQVCSNGLVEIWVLEVFLKHPQPIERLNGPRDALVFALGGLIYGTGVALECRHRLVGHSLEHLVEVQAGADGPIRAQKGGESCVALFHLPQKLGRMNGLARQRAQAADHCQLCLVEISLGLRIVELKEPFAFGAEEKGDGQARLLSPLLHALTTDRV